MGLYSYNAILTVIAVGALIHVPIGNVFSLCRLPLPRSGHVLVTASIDTWLLPFGLPPLTLPFVFVLGYLLALEDATVF